MVHFDFTYSDLEYFLLIFVRITSFVFVIPFFSMNAVPRRVRAGLSLFLTILLYGVMMPHEEIVYHTVLQYALIVTKEFATGILLGLGVSMCMSIVSLAGTVADMEVGFSMVSNLDPATRSQTTITGSIYQYMFLLIMIITGMYEYIIGALAESYTLIPVNGAVFHSDKLLNAMLGFLSEYVKIGFQISLPVFAAILLLDVVLGIMAKVSPQMNMFAVGLQLKVFAGLFVVMFTIYLIPAMSDLVFTEVKKITVSFVEAMMS